MTWEKIGRALSGKWRATCGGRVGLTEANLNTLAKKVFKQDPDHELQPAHKLQLVDCKMLSVELGKEMVVNKKTGMEKEETFTFWDW